MKTKFFTYLTMLLLVVSISSCSSGDSAVPLGNPGGNPGGGNPGGSNPGANDVWMQNNTFSPSTKTIAAGTTITWTNKESMNHNVTSNTGLFASTTLGLGATFSYTFSTAGTFNYNCTLHSGMNGTIIVQ